MTIITFPIQANDNSVPVPPDDLDVDAVLVHQAQLIREAINRFWLAHDHPAELRDAFDESVGRGLNLLCKTNRMRKA